MVKIYYLFKLRHLSSILVAAFIKKLSRMALSCPPADLKFIILFVYNLLIRHPNCKVLIHNSSKKKITDIKGLLKLSEYI